MTKDTDQFGVGDIAWPIRVDAQVHAPSAMLGDPAPYAGRDSYTFVRVQVRDTDGAEGNGFTGRFLAPEVAAFLNRIGPEIDGGGDDCIAAATRRFNPRGMTGVVVSALSALDVALADLCGQRAGVPVWRLLGAMRDHAPCHVTCGLPSLDDQAVVDACLAEVSAGATGVKVLVAAKGRSLSEDVARLAKVRDAIGPDKDLIADANCGWDGKTALEAAQAVSGLKLAWLEEPVRGNDPRALAALCDLGVVPIGAGQMEQSADRFDRLIEAGVSVIQPNAVFAGGMAAALTAARRAVQAGRRVSPGGGWDAINLHWMCGAMAAGSVELHRAQARIGRLLRPSHTVRDGQIWMSDAPGLGLEPDEAALAECRVW